MKKSELLEMLELDILDADGNLELQAEMVLARCLSVGMRPPKLRIDVKKCSEIEIEQGKWYKSRTYPIYRHQWEPENEA